MAVASNFASIKAPRILCRKKERDRGQIHPYKVIEITPPPKSLGVRCLAPMTSQGTRFSRHNFACTPEHWTSQYLNHVKNLQCGESVIIEGQAYTISAVTHRYQLRKGKYEPSEQRLDVLSTGRYILNLYLENLLEKS